MDGWMNQWISKHACDALNRKQSSESNLKFYWLVLNIIELKWFWGLWSREALQTVPRHNKGTPERSLRWAQCFLLALKRLLTRAEALQRSQPHRPTVQLMWGRNSTCSASEILLTRFVLSMSPLTSKHSLWALTCWTKLKHGRQSQPTTNES